MLSFMFESLSAGVSTTSDGGVSNSYWVSGSQCAELKEIINLTVCQKGKIITNDNRIEKCCYYNLDNDECESTNYIIVYYGEKAEYD